METTIERNDNTQLIKQVNGQTNGNNNTNGCHQQNGASKVDVENPKELIPQLCNHFYHLGWASGTGGGLSIRQNGLIYCAPSGVQKERIRPEDMFVLDETNYNILERPKNDKLKCSECLSLFAVAFKSRSAGCCIHSHSIHANLITALYSRDSINFHNQRNHILTTPGEFRISHQEMIKGIKKGSSDQNFNYNDTLIVPIIDNVLFERDLAGAMQEAINKYPLTNAVLVRNHGVYVWGKTWQQAKSMAECYDYLFKLQLEAVKCGFDWMLTK